MNFIIALGQCVLAGAFASWYFAYHKPDVSFRFVFLPLLVLNLFCPRWAIDAVLVVCVLVIISEVLSDLALLR